MSYLKKYPLSLMIICAILFLSFFNPPETELSKISNFDKYVHFGLYLGFCCVLWFEYLRCHTQLNKLHLIGGAIIAPIFFSGIIELGQTYLTQTRSGEWADFLCNTAGVLLAALVGNLFLKRWIWRKKSNKVTN